VESIPEYVWTKLSVGKFELPTLSMYLVMGPAPVAKLVVALNVPAKVFGPEFAAMDVNLGEAVAKNTENGWQSVSLGEPVTW
jgi:hypothetical protein